MLAYIWFLFIWSSCFGLMGDTHAHTNKRERKRERERERALAIAIGRRIRRGFKESFYTVPVRRWLITRNTVRIVICNVPG